MSDAEQESGPEAVRQALERHVTALREGDAFMITEFAAADFVTWEVRRAQDGTLHAHWWPVAWSELHVGGVLAEAGRSRIVQAAQGASRLLVCSAPDDPPAYEAFTTAARASQDAAMGQTVLVSEVPLDSELPRVLARAPLTQYYDLVALRRTAAGRLVLTTLPLFAPGASYGATETLTIRCEPSSDNGTAFSVLAYQPDERVFRPVPGRVAHIPPGTHSLTAELRGAGDVRFGLRDLPIIKFHRDHRSYEEVVAQVPERLDRLRPAHLILAIEISGRTGPVLERIRRAEQLIKCADGTDGPLYISLISYGPHAVDRRRDIEEPVTVLAWAQSGGVALSALRRLRERGAVTEGYSRAAQLECVLTRVARQLTDEHGRPVLVIVGSRSAFPARVDPRTEIIPCPDHNDWRAAWLRLRGRGDMTFGAIRDGGPGDDMWRALGSDASEQLTATDVRRFAADLGLVTAAVEYIPFPLVEAEGD